MYMKTIASAMTLALVFNPTMARAQSKARRSESYPLAGQGWGVKSGAETWLSRSVEDWSFLRDPDRSKGGLDGLKYVPLGQGGDTWLTVFGEQRLRGDYLSAIGLREGGRSQAPFLNRIFVGADLHAGEHFRLFTELAHASYNGHNVTTRAPAQEEDARLQQAFFDTTGRWGQAEVGLRVGRQEMVDGPQWLMTTRENANIHLTFDGVRAWAMSPDKRIDVYELRYLEEGTGAFDDGTSSSRRLRGATAGFVVPGQGALFFDPFWINARDDARRWGSQVAREDRHFAGAHLYGSRGRLSLDTAAVYQWGDYGNRDIRAFGGYATFKWALSQQGLKPTLGFHADITSGGGGGDGTLRNGSLLYGALPYFSYATWFGGSNYVDAAVNFQFAPTARTSVALEYQRMWRHRLDDAVYTGAGAVYAGTAGLSGRHTGDLLRLNASWNLHRYVSLTVRAERFLAGDPMERAGYGDTTFFGSWLRLRF